MLAAFFHYLGIPRGVVLNQFLIVFGLLCAGSAFLITLAIGIGLLIFNKRRAKFSGLSQGWQSVTGKVLTNCVREVTSNDEGTINVNFYPEVVYQYNVSGQDYSSKRLSFGAVTPQKSKEAVQKVLEQYPVGSTLLVYYDSQNPAEAVIERAAGRVKWVMVLAILALIVAGCIGFGVLIGLINYFA